MFSMVTPRNPTTRAQWEANNSRTYWTQRRRSDFPFAHDLM